MRRIDPELLQFATPEELAALSSLADAEDERLAVVSDLLTFAEYVEPSFVRYRHTVYLAEQLERLIDPGDDLRRLLISMPPRSGKTMLASTIFPAYVLAKHPDRTVMITSATASLAERNLSPKVREYFRSSDLLDNISPDRRSKSYFKLAGRSGGLVAAGVGGLITGLPANLLIVDDPVKSAEDAASKSKSNAIWDWWQSTARTRLEPDAAVAIVMTRWSESDLAGRVLENDTEGEWRVINLPAVAAEGGDELGREPGEALVPERFDADDLALVKQEVGPKVWASLYQGRPIPDEGDYFTTPPGTYQVADDGSFVLDGDIVAAAGCRSFYSVDGAATVGSNRDPSGVVLATWTPTGHLLVRNAWELRLNGPGLEEWIERTFANDDRASHVFIEQSPVSRHLIDSLKAGRRVPIRSEAPRDSKDVRAIGLQRLLDTGRVFFPPVESDGLTELRRQLLSFPFGDHDDLVDALAWAANQSGGVRRSKVRASAAIPDTLKVYS